MKRKRKQETDLMMNLKWIQLRVQVKSQYNMSDHNISVDPLPFPLFLNVNVETAIDLTRWQNIFLSNLFLEASDLLSF